MKAHKVRRRPAPAPHAARPRRRPAATLGTVAAALLAAALLLAPAASAAPPPPHWTVISQPAPTDFHPGDSSDFYEVLAVNNGYASTEEVTLTDTLPQGITVNAISSEGGACEQLTSEATVTVTCRFGGASSGGLIVANINVSVPVDASGPLLNAVSVFGGGASEAAEASNLTPVTPASQQVPFGASLASSVSSAAGGPDTQAGSHPFALTTLLDFNVGSVNPNEHCVDGSSPSCAALNAQAKDLEVALPPGLLGNPTAAPYCTQAQFERFTFRPCPASTQVGSMYLFFYGAGTAVQVSPVYNIEPPPGQPGELGFSISTLAHIPIFFHLRSDGDYGLTADVANINQFDAPRIAALSIWGNPSDEAHDGQRESQFGNCSEGCSSGIEDPRPFLTLPTRCSGTPLPLSGAGDSWQEPLGAPLPALSGSSLGAMTGCDNLQFEPTLQARPTTAVSDSPSGLQVDIHVPQPESTTGLVEANLEEARVTLPKGLTLNPAAAAGREGCTPAQIGLTSALGAIPIRTTAGPADCLDASKLGTVEVDTPLIDHPLPGAVYLAQPYANPFKSLLALYITVDDPRTGIVVKLAGKVEIAPDGRLTTTVTESPEVPFEDFKLDFFGGARAPLRTPATCGTYETTSQLTPYSAPDSGPPATPADIYRIEFGPNGQACPSTEAAEPDKPSFEAGTASPLAGAYSPFVLHLHREDGSQVFSALDVSLPPGLVGKLAGASYCPDSILAAAANRTGIEEQAAPSCPAASHIGTVDIGAGAGPSPDYVQGTAYLAGPYKGAPLSIAILTPAVAGPFDLGTVVVRSALYVNPETTQITVRSDPIPTELQGIQLDVRSIDLSIDRHEFTLNPTSCERKAVTGEEISSLNQAAALTSPFQVGDCAALPFSPRLKIDLKGATKRNRNPALRAVLTEGVVGEANVAKASVALPHSEFLDQAHIRTVCTRVQFAAGVTPGEECPKASIYGHAKAITPLLDKPLEGPVYLRSSSHKLPDLVAALNGQVDVDLDGRIDTDKADGIRTTFSGVPDAAVSKFTLEMQGGKRGLLVNSEDICGKPQRATAKILAQNGKNANQSPLIANGCGVGKHHQRYG
jgi:uncharacterized repeat protein (TIGR01451 family)